MTANVSRTGAGGVCTTKSHMHHECIHYSEISKEALNPRWRLCGVIRCPGFEMEVLCKRLVIILIVFEALFCGMMLVALCFSHDAGSIEFSHDAGRIVFFA